MGLSFSFTSGKNPVCCSVVLPMDYESGVFVYVCWITTVWAITPCVLDTRRCWLLPTTCTIEILDTEFLPCFLKNDGLIFFGHNAVPQIAVLAHKIVSLKACQFILLSEVVVLFWILVGHRSFPESEERKVARTLGDGQDSRSEVSRYWTNRKGALV